jgi:hypothetical protein
MPSPIKLEWCHIHHPPISITTTFRGKKMVGLIMALKSLDYYSKHLKTIGLLTTTKKFGKNLPKGNVTKIMNHLCKS